MPDSMGNDEILVLAGRDNEVKLVAEACAALFAEATTAYPWLIFFAGWRGLGKSRLLRTLAAKPNSEALLTLFVPGESLQTTHNSLKRSVDVWVELENFFKLLHEQLNRLLPSWAKLDNYNRLLENRVLRADHEGLALRAITLAGDLVRLRLENRLAVLLLHDDASPKVFQWLSKYFYKKLFDHRALCVVTTSPSAPTVSSLSLLPFFHTVNLEPLAPELAYQILEPFRFADEVRIGLVELSMGHPACLSQGVRLLVQRYHEGPGFADRQRIAEAMAAELLAGLSGNLAQFCLYLAPLRLFSYDLLANLLPLILPNDQFFSHAGPADYLRLGRELNDEVDFIESGTNYTMQPAARHILAQSLDYPDLTTSPLRRIHERTAQYYLDLLGRLRPEQRPEAALEHIFHQLHYQARVNSSPADFSYLPARLGGAQQQARLCTLLVGDADLSHTFPLAQRALLAQLS